MMQEKYWDYMRNAFTSSSDVLVKIGRAIRAIFDLVLLGGQFNNTLLVDKLWYYSIDDIAIDPTI